jgi:iron complex outermembrane recepter protein
MSNTPKHPARRLLMKLNTSRICGSVLVLASGATNPVIAADDSLAASTSSAPETAQALEEVTVTAERRETDLQKTAIAVTALSQEDLKSRSVTNFSDLAGAVPGLSISGASTTAPGAALPVVYIRGIGQQDPSIFQDPGVGIYVDGVYVARSAGSTIDLPDINRVEVLRGPQGTLFGKNAVGGAINIVTRDPSEEATGSLEATGGDYRLVDVRGYFSGPLSEALQGSIATDLKSEQGYVDRLAYPSREVIGDQGAQNHRSVRGRLRWEPASALTVDFSADYTRYRDSSAAGIGFLTAPTSVYNLWNNSVAKPAGNPWTQANTNTGNFYQTFATGPNYADDDIEGTSATVTYKAAAATFRSISAYRYVNEEYSRDSDGSPADFFAATGSHKLHQLSEELQLFGQSFDDRLDWIGGLYFLRETGAEEDLALIAPGLYTLTHNSALELGRLYGVSVSTYSYAAFGELTYHLTDKLGLTAGLRETREHKAADVSSLGTESDTLYVPLTHRSDTFGAWTPKFSVQYQAADALLLYASASEGFKSGGFNGRVSQPAGLTEFQPEKVWSYETGFKLTALDRRLRLNVAGFYMDYSNIQLAYFILTPQGVVNAVESVAAARIDGVEAEVVAVPLEGLRIGGTVSTNNNYYSRIQAGAQVMPGDKIPYVPEYQESAFIEYGARLPNGGELVPRADYSHQSKSYSVINNSPASLLDARTLVNARLTYRFPGGRWSLAAFGTNLGNERYYTSAQDNTSASLLYKLVGPPREYGATVTYQY